MTTLLHIAEASWLILPWYLYCLAAGVLLYPVIQWLFPSLKDGGWSLTRLAALGLPAWLDAMDRFLMHGGESWRILLWITGPGALLIFGAVGMVTWWRDAPHLWNRLTEAKRFIWAEEICLIAAWLVLAFIRSSAPGIEFSPNYHAGEKYTDMMVLQAVTQAETFPPEDPWFAENPLNYYYFGQAMVALPARLLKTPPAEAYNHGFCMIGALIAMQLFGLLLQVTSNLRWASAGSFALLVGGNWVMSFRHLFPDTARLHLPGGEWEMGVTSSWIGTRILEGSITEFPAFTLLLGDLHPHLIALPLWLAWCAWLCELLASNENPHGPVASSSGFTLPPFLVQPIVTWLPAAWLAGALFAAHSWYLITAGISLVIAGFVASTSGAFKLRYLPAFLMLGAVAALTGLRLLFAGFIIFFQSPFSAQSSFNTEGPLAAINVVPFELRSAFVPYLLHWGPLIGLLLLALGGIAILSWERLKSMNPFILIGGAVWFGVMLLSLAMEWPRLQADTGIYFPAWAMAAVLMLIPFLFAFRGEAESENLLLVSLGILGLILIVLPEIIYLNDPFEGEFARINTVFKLSFAAWPILGIASFGLLARVWEELQFSGRRIICSILLTGAAMLVLPMLRYPLIAIPSRLAQASPGDRNTPPTLDGWAFSEALEEERRDDYRAIRYLAQLDLPAGTRIIEAHDGTYGYAARFASNLGLPSMLGWEQHVRNWRPPSEALEEMIDRRKSKIALFYDPLVEFSRLRMLQTEGFQIVVFGATEYEKYGDDSRALLAADLTSWTRRNFGKTTLWIAPNLRVP